MAKVKIVKSNIRLTNYQVGDVISLPDELAAEMIASGIVEDTENATSVESADATGAEDATTTGKKGKAPKE